MKKQASTAGTFIPTDILRIVIRIQATWTKLTEREIAYYLEGRRDKLLKTLQKKYHFVTLQQADVILSDIERLA